MTSPTALIRLSPAASRQPATALACLGAVALIAYADYATGYELTLSILYLAPICAVTWHLGLRAGVGMSVVAVLAWTASDILAGHHYSHPFYRWWEGLIKLATWALFSVLLARLKTALQRSDARFITVLEGVDALVYVADMTSGLLLYANPRCQEAYDAIADRDHAQHIENRWTADTGGTRPGAISASSLDAPATSTVECRDAATDRDFVVHARAMRWVDGRPVRLVIASDITATRRAERLAREHEKRLAAAARLIVLGEMASTLAHELNQPLAAIANYNRGALIPLRSAGPDFHDIADAIAKAAQQAERAGEVVRRVRDLVRRREPHLAPCLIETAIAQITPVLEADARRAEILFTVDVDGNIPAVRADALLVEQVLLNLARNAVDAIQDSGKPGTVSFIVTRKDMDRLTVCVQDTGPGVPPALLEGTAPAFFTTKQDGTGIGLQVCRAILEAHGTTLKIERPAAGGSRFSFDLRIAP